MLHATRPLHALLAVIALIVIAGCAGGGTSGTPARASAGATVAATDAAEETSAPTAEETAEPTHETDATESPGSSPQAGVDFQVVESDALRIRVPGEWTDVHTAPWDFNETERVGESITAAPDIQGWYDTFDVPGVFFAASSSLADRFDAESLLDQYDFSNQCTFDRRQEVTLADLSGFQDLYGECGGESTDFTILALAPEDGAYVVLLQLQAPEGAEPDDFRRVARSVEVHDPDALGD